MKFQPLHCAPKAVDLPPQEPTGHYVIHHKKHGYLLSRIDGWGRAKPSYTSDPCCAIGMSKADAGEQKAFLQWAPHRQPAQSLSIVTRERALRAEEETQN